MHKLDSEKYYGNIEYKQELSNMDHNKIQKYASQMKFRLQEGNGHADRPRETREESTMLPQNQPQLHRLRLPSEMKDGNVHYVLAAGQHCGACLGSSWRWGLGPLSWRRAC